MTATDNALAAPIFLLPNAVTQARSAVDGDDEATPGEFMYSTGNSNSSTCSKGLINWDVSPSYGRISGLASTGVVAFRVVLLRQPFLALCARINVDCACRPIRPRRDEPY
jgi:hypothetical protein